LQRTIIIRYLMYSVLVASDNFLYTNIWWWWWWWWWFSPCYSHAYRPASWPAAADHVTSSRDSHIGYESWYQKTNLRATPVGENRMILGSLVLTHH